jgi:hypothetical protein
LFGLLPFSRKNPLLVVVEDSMFERRGIFGVDDEEAVFSGWFTA